MSFFNKVNDAVSKVGQASSNLKQIKVLEFEIGKKNKEINEKFEVLGSLYYCLDEDQEKSDHILEIEEELDLLHAAILKNKEEIESLKPDKIICEDCGKALTEEAKFCGNCGGKAVIDNKKQKICPSCSSTNKAESKFCSKCGSDLEDVEVLS